MPHWRYIGLFFIILSFTFDLFAQDELPQTSGFRGHVLTMPGVFFVQSNLIVSGAPLLGDVGNPRIASIFDTPESQAVAALPIAGELNYTFSKSRTQIFFGNRLVDIIRLDGILGFGIRQELGKGGILVANILITPLELNYWSDPFIEGEDRTPTPLNLPGFRVRWGRIFQTNFEITLSARQYKYADERSGEWLMEQGRLNPDELASLNRNGEMLEVILGYKIKMRQHQLQPAFRYNSNNHNGSAIANKRSTILLDYTFRSSKMALNTKMIYTKREADHIHPVFSEKGNSNGYGFVIGAVFPVTLFNSENWNFTIGGEYARENFNIDFYTSRIAALTAGLLWRKKTK
jgi:hypothetical protein